MKKILFLMLFLSFKLQAQSSKIEAVVTATETGNAIVGVVKKTNPVDNYYGITGTNNSINGFGGGVFGSHAGSGSGVYGSSQTGTGVTGYSPFGRGVSGLSNGSGGVGGYFNSTFGHALITGTGNVGIGLNSPTLPLDVNGRIRIRNNGGNNTSGIWYDDDTGLQRVFVGMETNELFGFFGNQGWSFRFNATNGNVGIGTVPTSNKLEVYGTIGSSSIAANGNNQLYANSTGTIIATAPVAFSVYNPTVTALNLVSGVTTTFNFNTDLYDLGGFFNNTNYEFVAPVYGIYHFDVIVNFSGVATISNANPSYFLDLYKNDISYLTVTEPLFVGSSKTLNLSQDLILTAGEKIKVKIAQTSGNNVTISGGKLSNFTGHLVTRL